MLSKKRKIYVWIISALIVLTLAFIWLNSFMPQAESMKASDGTQDVLQTVLDSVFGEGSILLTEDLVRNSAHFSEFFALGAELSLLIIALKRENYKSYLTLLPIGLFVAVIDECIQMLSDRCAEVADVLLDYCGYLAAILIFTGIFAIRYAAKTRKNNRNKEKEV